MYTGTRGVGGKRAKTSWPCRVCSKECSWQRDSIQCDGCEAWMHVECAKMSTLQYNSFSCNDGRQFFCKDCSSDSPGRYGAGRYNYRAALARIKSHAPDLERMRQQADSEHHLMTFYGVILPQVSTPSSRDVSVDQSSVDLLTDHCPWLLTKFIPANVGGDGNCLYRSVSVAVYGSDSEYAHLRLLAAIEALLFPRLYDSNSTDFYAPFKADQSLVLANYEVFVNELVTDGTYSDMLSVLCLSSVVQKPIQTRWPIVAKLGQASPFTKLVVGRDVHTANAINILWTTAKYPGKGQTCNINHFVPLIVLSVASSSRGPVVTDSESDEVQTGTPAEGKSESDTETVSELNVVTGKKLNGQFVSTSELLNILLDDSFCPVFETVPTGLKEDCGVKVRHVDGGHIFWDDCGAWIGRHGKKSYHAIGSAVELERSTDGVFGVRRQVDGKKKFVPHESQPTVFNILHRLYSKLRRDESYERRISYIDGSDFFLAEYLGTFPQTVESHGNAKVGGEYVRTHPGVLTKIVKSVKEGKKSVLRAYSELNDDDEEDLMRPRNKQQVQNAAFRLRHGDNGTTTSSLNLGDEVQTIMSCLTDADENFVQAVNVQLHRSPGVILFTKEQMSDIRTFCSDKTGSELRSVLSFDRTFNLSSLFVTVMVYKNKKVVRRVSQEPPIFVGPILLHGDEAANADDEDDRIAQVMQSVRRNNIDVVDYLQTRVLPKIKSNNEIKWANTWIGQRQWTNNNCESANHLLKVAIDWKPRRVTDLIGHLRSVVRQQTIELRRSLAGLGDYQLAPAFASRHLTTQMRWNAMSKQCKDNAFAKFMDDEGTLTTKKTVTSKDGLLTVVGCPRVARKIGQRRRPMAERAATKK